MTRKIISPVRMFKKPIPCNKRNVLKGNQKRQLKESLLKAFPSIPQPALEALLPQKQGMVMLVVMFTCTRSVSDSPWRR